MASRVRSAAYNTLHSNRKRPPPNSTQRPPTRSAVHRSSLSMHLRGQTARGERVSMLSPWGREPSLCSQPSGHASTCCSQPRPYYSAPPHQVSQTLHQQAAPHQAMRLVAKHKTCMHVHPCGCQGCEPCLPDASEAAGWQPANTNTSAAANPEDSRPLAARQGPCSHGPPRRSGGSHPTGS